MRFKEFIKYFEVDDLEYTQLGKKYFSYDTLQEKLEELIGRF